MSSPARNAARLLLLSAVAAQCTPCFDGGGNAAGTPAFPAASCGAVSVCGLPDGVYWLSPSGTPYQAQCTGGWTLAMKIDGAQQTFAYSSAYWTDGNLLNAGAVTGAGVDEAKLAPFLDLPGDSIKMVMTASNGQAGSPVVVTPGAFESLRALFNGGYIATNTALSSWHAIAPGGAPYQANCNKQGVNNQHNSLWNFQGQQYTWKKKKKKKKTHTHAHTQQHNSSTWYKQRGLPALASRGRGGRHPLFSFLVRIFGHELHASPPPCPC